mmetsp:Transcript_21393/g.32258  ORF Transcript_21393/g.32258 Transcript_21393/m.32258 type:complete len:119 (+) Transcript_21393:206-562(+)
MPNLLSICQCFSTHSSSTLAATNDGSYDGSCLETLLELKLMPGVYAGARANSTDLPQLSVGKEAKEPLALLPHNVNGLFLEMILLDRLMTASSTCSTFPQSSPILPLWTGQFTTDAQT